MPYDSTDDLPGEVREPLPPAAQELYLEAYNTAHAEYSDPETDTDESFAELARADAWDAAEREYEEVDGEYVQNGGGDMQYS
jgi:cation transport regulator